MKKIPQNGIKRIQSWNFVPIGGISAPLSKRITNCNLEKMTYEEFCVNGYNEV